MHEVRLFMVRVWRNEQGFRASVRQVEEERLHLFATPDDLAQFFAAEYPENGPDGSATAHRAASAPLAPKTST